jgi:hypothetical protein
MPGQNAPSPIVQSEQKRRTDYRYRRCVILKQLTEVARSVAAEEATVETAQEHARLATNSLEIQEDGLAAPDSGLYAAVEDHTESLYYRDAPLVKPERLHWAAMSACSSEHLDLETVLEASEVVE